jgi:hemerythrin-like domain-containing protein
MRIVDEIRRQHRHVDRVAGSLRRWAQRGIAHPDAVADQAELIGTLRVLVLDHHHRIEEILFEALVEHGEIPGHHGPIAVLRREHDAAANAIDRFEALGVGDGAAGLAMEIAAELWQHVDKEESVLLPEAERRLIDGGVRDLDFPDAPTVVEATERAGLDLARRLPPMDDPEVIRGDGCIVCPAFGIDCHGIETEWWSDWEREHYASLDEG